MTIKPFTHTAKGLPLCLVPSKAPYTTQIWRVLLCGVQIAEAFIPSAVPDMFCVEAFSPDDTGMPDVDDIHVMIGADLDRSMREALDQFADAFLAAAAAEQALMEAA